MKSGLLKWIALAVVLCLCQGCNSQKRPEEKRQKAYKKLLIEGADLLKRQKFQDAFDMFDRAVTKMPEAAEGYLNRGITRVLLKEYEKAVGDFTEAIKRDDKLAIAYADRGIAYDHLGQQKEALSDYKKALAIDPNQIKGPGFLERFMYKKPKTPDVRERAVFLEKTMRSKDSRNDPS
ncbi:MAG: tetratricopeptide repeat protein [Deltaproteobacteria bacterium]|nr:tetratricopeptide repeat protein [Deltaproteobacteria bacterium]